MGAENIIIENIKKGSIKDVVLFSDTDVAPTPPYVVVKPETGIKDNTIQYRIIVYHQKGRFDELKEYVLNELDQLLHGYISSAKGGFIKLYKNGFGHITPDTIDNSYFMERIYFIPVSGIV